MAPETVGAVIARTRAAVGHRAPTSRSRSKPTRPRSRRRIRGPRRGRRQPRVARRAGARPRGAHFPRPRAFGRRGACRDRDRAPALRALFVRPDLRPARPDAGGLAAELERALALAGEHLSLYQLTIERGTRFFAEHARGAFVLPGEEEAARDVRADAGAARGRRPAGLRDLQPCAAGRRMPP